MSNRYHWLRVLVFAFYFIFSCEVGQPDLTIYQLF